jgi:hypothetical protein
MSTYLEAKAVRSNCNRIIVQWFNGSMVQWFNGQGARETKAAVIWWSFLAA